MLRAAFVSHIDRTLFLFRLPLMRALLNRGWRVTAMAPEEGYGRRFQEWGVDFVDWPVRRGSINPIREAGAVAHLAAGLRKLAPKLIHAFAIKASLYTAAAAELAGLAKPLVSITGLGSFLPGVSRGLLGGVCRVASPWVAGAVFQNRDDQELFRRLGARFRRVELIRGSGVDLERFSEARFDRGAARAAFGLPERAAVVLMPARLVWDKGIREFVEASSELRRRYGERVVCLVAGDFYEGNPNPVPREYIQAAQQAGAIRHVGWVEDMPALLAAADIVALPSYREGLPVSLQEALAMGRPVVACDVPGSREAIEDGRNGFLVSVRDSRSLAEAISKLIENPTLRQTMGEAGRRKAEKEFDVRKIVQAHLALYARLGIMTP